MNSSAIEANLDRIRLDLVNRGLTYDPLMDDLLDHVCCMVEDEMESGNDFDSSYGNALASIEPNSITNIQHQTLLLLDKKFQRMKNFTYLFGLTSAIVAIIGAFFKKMHWPGAGILITVGIALVLLVFLPLYFIINQREQPEKKNPVYAIVGYFTLAFLLAGALFKIMHWPGAGIMIEISIGFLLIGFIPLYVVNAFQKGGGKKITLPYIVMLLVGISIVMLFINVRMSKNILDIYMEGSLHNETVTELVQDRSAHLIELSGDTAHTDVKESVASIHDKARELQSLITNMQETMIAHVGQVGLSIEKVKGIDNRNAGREAILGHDNGQQFNLASEEFRAMLNELIDDPVTFSQIEDHLKFTGDLGSFLYSLKDGVAGDPLMKNYYKLSDASKGIALSEYVAISYLLHH